MKAHKAEISALKSQWTARRVEACAQGTGGKILIQLEQMRGEQKKKSCMSIYSEMQCPVWLWSMRLMDSRALRLEDQIPACMYWSRNLAFILSVLSFPALH